MLREVLQTNGEQDMRESDDRHVPLLADPELGKPAAEPAKVSKYGLLSVLRFCTWYDLGAYLLGLAAACAFGAVLPLQSIILGKIFSGSAGVDASALRDNILDHIPDLLKLGAMALVSGFVQHACLISTSERVVKRVRTRCMEALLEQEVAFFDSETVGKLSTTLSTQSQVLLRGLGESVGLALTYTSQMVTGFVIAFTMSSKVAFAMLLVVPFNTLVVVAIVVATMSRVRRINKNAELVGSFADDVLSAMQTVASMCAQGKVIERYDAFLGIEEALGTVLTAIKAVGTGCIYGVIFVSYGLGYWFGSHVVASMSASFGDVLSAVFSCVIGSIAIGIAMPNIQSIASAREAAQDLFEVIDRQPQLADSSAATTAIAPAAAGGAAVQGNISFEGVQFRYPGREQTILGDVSFSVKAGTTCALVGPSGCGKSTCIALLQRFYDMTGGHVRIDGVDVRDLPLEYLRDQMALVSQEPILFDASIRENILLGRKEDDLSREMFDGQDPDYVAAAKQSNAHDFVSAFPLGYDTSCGARGTQLSGGQKQRIAIARALVRKPKILLLDEATSALDNASEAVVQRAIDSLLDQHKLTSIVIAHRLSTVRNADQIVVFGESPDAAVEGSVVLETGSHDELMARPDGAYQTLVRLGESAESTLSVAASPTSQRVAERRSSSRASEKPDDAWRALQRASSSLSRGAASSLLERDELAAVEPERAEQDDEEEEEKMYPVSSRRVWALNRPEIPYLIFGAIGASVKGAVQPCMSLILAHLLTHFVVVPNPILAKPCLSDADCDASAAERCFSFADFGMDTAFCYNSFRDGYGPSDVRATGLSALWTYLALGTAVGTGLAMSVYGFGFAGLKLTRRLRLGVFSSLCRQDASFFDQPSNNVGTLLSRLSNDAVLVQNATGEFVGLAVENSVAVLVAAGIAFRASWRMTSVVFLPCAILVWSAFNDQKRLSRFAQAQVLDKRSEKIVNQALSSVRTVYSCAAQRKIRSMYAAALEAPMRSGIRGAQVMGLQTGLSQAAYQLIYSFAFWYGARLVKAGEIDTQSLSRVFFVLTISATFIGNSIAQANDASKADVATSKLFQIMDRVSRIDYTSDEGKKKAEAVEGAVVFRDVSFHYPTRPDVMVLDRFSCEIAAGQTVAFVGPSGSGKSSVIRLLERFYDPVAGSVSIDGVDLRSYNLQYLRSQIGLVSQEPVLFQGSIYDNIVFGCQHATAEDVERVARSANVHEFVQAFPDGYDTDCGSGKQLSGGQKQRIAIARALLKDPPILCLDEATSALDNESEKVVQAALSELMQTRKRTTLVVAHRLSTVIDADKIVVVQAGRIKEQGTHAELMAREDGVYAQLHRTQHR